MARSWLIICFLISSANLTIEKDNISVLQLINSIREEKDFSYLLLMKNLNSSISNKFNICLTRSLMEKLQMPIMQLDERVNYPLLTEHSSRLLTVVYLVGTDLNEHEGLLKGLVVNLRQMNTARVVFMVQLAEVNMAFLYNLFTFCLKMKLLNVLALFEDFLTGNNFYSYTQFPKFELEQRVYDPKSVIYPERLRNLNGYNLTVITGSAPLRVTTYHDKQGKLVLHGTAGHLIDAFQQKHNCKITQPLAFNPNVPIAAMDLVAAVRNGTVEMSLGVSYPSLPFKGFTYPYEIENWCLMLPMEPDRPPADYYYMVFDLNVLFLTLATLVLISITLSLTLRYHGYHVLSYEYLLHENCLRGALGQSFCEVFQAPVLVRGIYLKICVFGILLTAWFNSYFSAFVTSSPKVAPFRSYDDILASHLKIVAWQPEYDSLIGRLVELRKYEPMFWVEPNLNKYINLRDSFNTKYGYIMTDSKWALINAQQDVFSKPLFRLRDDLCFFKNVPFGFPVQDNSFFIEPLEALILDLAATGLSLHWTLNGFREQVEAGKLHFSDLSPRREFRAMQVEDMKCIWYGFAFLAALSTTVWLIELFWNWTKRRLMN